MFRNAFGSVIFVALAGAFFAYLISGDGVGASLLTGKAPAQTTDNEAISRRPAAVASYHNTGYSDAVHIPKSANGHFYTDLQINRRAINVLIDTGASFLALRESDARAAGLYARAADFIYIVNTANGQVKAARLRAREIELGRLVVRDAEVLILPDESLSISLLGMNVLSQLGKVAFNQSELVIERAH